MNTLKRAAARVFLIFASILTLFPIIFNIYSSFKTNREFIDITGNPLALPARLNFDNYERAWVAANIGGNFVNSAAAVLILLITVILCVIPCSYALARYAFPGRGIMLGVFMAAIFIKASYIMIPLFLIMHGLGVTNNLPAYSIVYAVTQFPFSIFLMTGYMRSIPRDYEEAARMDGCGNFGILTRIITPMAKPGIFTVCMLSGMAIWNEYPLALVMLTQNDKMTLPAGIAALYIRAGYQTDFTALLAALVIVLIPTLFFYCIGQRYLIEGIASGGIKG